MSLCHFWIFFFLSSKRRLYLKRNYLHYEFVEKCISAQTHVNHKRCHAKKCHLSFISQLEKEYQYGDIGLTDINLC